MGTRWAQKVHRTRKTDAMTGAALIGGAACLLLIVALRSWPATPDGLFHLYRIDALAAAFASGTLYPRWFPDFAFGYGYPVLNFYAPGFYVPAAVLAWAGVDVAWAARVGLAGAYALSGAAAYLAARVWVRALPALFATVVYLVFPYRLYDLFVRGALPEFAAFVWLPLLAWAVGEAWQAEAAERASGHSIRHTAHPALLAALAVAGLILTHNLTALMVAILAPLLVISLIVLGKPRLAVWMIGVGLLGALLSAPYALPALAEARWVRLLAAEASRGYAAHFADWRGLWDWSAFYHYPAADQPSVPLPGWAALILAAGLGMAFTPWGRGRRLFLLGSVVVALGLIWLLTPGSAALWEVGAPVLRTLQFPWRWQAILAALVAAVAAVTAEMMLDAAATRRAQAVTTALIIGMSAYLVVASVARLPQAETARQDVDITTGAMWAFDAEHGQVGATWTGEFTPVWVQEQRWAIGRDPSTPESSLDTTPLPEGVVIQPVTQGYTSAAYSVTATAPFTLTLDRFYYPAWRVAVDGRPVATAATGSLGLLAAAIPAGADRVTVEWAATPAVWGGRLLFALGWLAGAALLWVGASRRRGLLLGVWGVVGIVAGLAASDVLAAQTQLQAVDADFGPVHLMAASTPGARPGEVAPVQLAWTIEEASVPLVAFVHVVDGAGEIVAQYDGPLGGDYMPASRWRPGMALQTAMPVALPATLTPGQYALKVGVYRPGAAQTPLLPAGRADPRVDAGALEVRP